MEFTFLIWRPSHRACRSKCFVQCPCLEPSRQAYRLCGKGAAWPRAEVDPKGENKRKTVVCRYEEICWLACRGGAVAIPFPLPPAVVVGALLLVLFPLVPVPAPSRGRLSQGPQPVRDWENIQAVSLPCKRPPRSPAGGGRQPSLPPYCLPQPRLNASVSPAPCALSRPLPT